MAVKKVIKLNVWAYVGALIVLLFLIGVGFWTVGMLSPVSLTCKSKSPFKTCGFFKAVQDEAKRSAKGLSNDEADAVVAEVLANNKLEPWFIGNTLTIKYVKGKTSYTITEQKTTYLQIDQSWSDVEYATLFELGHEYFYWTWCTAQKNKGLVCSVSRITIKEVEKRNIVQSHLFADKFVETKGKVPDDPKFISSLVDYRDTDARVQEILAANGY